MSLSPGRETRLSHRETQRVGSGIMRSPWITNGTRQRTYVSSASGDRSSSSVLHIAIAGGVLPVGSDVIVTRRRPSRVNTVEPTVALRVNETSSAPFTLHRFAVLSVLPVARNWPLG